MCVLPFQILPFRFGQTPADQLDVGLGVAVPALAFFWNT
jgi:hypothetical protein